MFEQFEVEVARLRWVIVDLPPLSVTPGEYER